MLHRVLIYCTYSMCKDAVGHRIFEQDHAAQPPMLVCDTVVYLSALERLFCNTGVCALVHLLLWLLLFFYRVPWRVK